VNCGMLCPSPVAIITCASIFLATDVFSSYSVLFLSPTRLDDNATPIAPHEAQRSSLLIGRNSSSESRVLLSSDTYIRALWCEAVNAELFLDHDWFVATRAGGVWRSGGSRAAYV
jgi:hypothetical protein